MNLPDNNTKQFNLPSYIQTPLFLYKDKRLEKAATTIASFFYSLFTAGKSIKASKDYLCQLAGIKKSQYYEILNQLEFCSYICRTGNTNTRKIQWIYCPNPTIIIDESEENRSDKNLNTSPVHRTKLVRPTGLNYSGTPDTYNKVDNKVDNLKHIPASTKPGKNKVIRDYEKDERFMRFYSAYPKKEDPRDSWKAFKSIVGNNDVLLEQIISDIELRKSKHSKWQDRQYIKYPAVYLRKGEYLGELFNAEDDAAIKNEKKQQENKDRIEKQEAASKFRAENERRNNELKQSDAICYRKIVKQVPSKTVTNAIQGLKIHLRA